MYTCSYKGRNQVCLFISMMYLMIPLGLYGQCDIVKNPYQLDWINNKIDAIPTYDSSTLDFVVGHKDNDTLIQTRELIIDELIRVETFDLSGNTIQLCYDSPNGLLCDNDSTMVILENSRIFWQTGNAIDCDQRDSLELLRFYWSMDGPNWQKTWDLDQDKSTWHDVTFHSNGCVKGLVADDSIKGRLLDFHFQEIEELRFGFTINLVDTIPNFRHMPELEIFSILGTSVSGKVPNFEYLPVLRLLSLRSSDLSGSIPNFDYLPNLKNLTLNGQQLTGEIPIFDRCPLLRYVDLAQNALEGSLPSFEYHPDLIQLNAGSNKLTGEIPKFDGNPNLQFLSLSDNELSGSIPTFENNPLLRSVSLQYNLLTDTIPDLKNYPSLRTFRVSNNQLVGLIPSFENTMLDYFECNNNFLTRPVPDYSIYCPTMVYCDITNNNLTFEDIVPTCAANDSTCVSMFPEIQINGYYYANQKLIYLDTTIYKSIGDSLTIDLAIDKNMDNSIYTWYKNDTILYTEIVGYNTLQFTNLQPIDSGNYKVSITNDIAPDLTLKSRVISLVVDNITATNDIVTSISKIYPNPTSDKLTIATNTGFQPGDMISIYDMKGILIKQHKITNKQHQVALDLSDIPIGLYIIQFKDKGQLINKQLVKI